ncbi:hypothetical protein [Photobacterium leiognathi]|uniref:hypothetical protein n=1 Tax=Photobacterium leiognathi TaxID=553611 RepID=UPI002735F375|nr:hypothetical protein [Photobacterium leiognathi]
MSDLNFSTNIEYFINGQKVIFTPKVVVFLPLLSNMILIKLTFLKNIDLQPLYLNVLTFKTLTDKNHLFKPVKSNIEDLNIKQTSNLNLKKQSNKAINIKKTNG